MRNFVDYYYRYTERITDINDAAKNSPQGLVDQMEGHYRRRVNEIADFICTTQCKGHKVIMLAGPSSSGKTTTASMLCERINDNGFASKRISLDEFFLGKERTPLLPDGTPDYESIDALDIPLMTECLSGLVKDGECMMPSFDFEKQRPRKEREYVKLDKDEVVIVEGIHALNPIVSGSVPDESLLKIYITIKQGLYEGEEEVITSHELRLARRMVRDMMFRGCSPEVTLESWPKVIAGEQKFIHPFRRSANVIINSIHIYEPCIISQIALPLLHRINEGNEYYEQASHLAEKLEMFEPLPPSLIPANSLMREFIGNGIYG